MKLLSPVQLPYVVKCTALYSNAGLPLGQTTSGLWAPASSSVTWSFTLLKTRWVITGAMSKAEVLRHVLSQRELRCWLQHAHPHRHLFLQSGNISLHGTKGVLKHWSFYIVVYSLPPATCRKCLCAFPIKIKMLERERERTLIWGKKNNNVQYHLLSDFYRLQMNHDYGPSTLRGCKLHCLLNGLSGQDQHKGRSPYTPAFITDSPSLPCPPRYSPWHPSSPGELSWRPVSAGLDVLRWHNGSSCAGSGNSSPSLIQGRSFKWTELLNLIQWPDTKAQ